MRMVSVRLVTPMSQAVLNSDHVYEIGNAGQLYWFADKVNKEFYGNANAVLTADIVVNKNVLNDGDLTKDVDGLRDWTPIQQYGGTFDGAQHTISGIYCVSDTIDEAGIFQHTTDNAIVQNIGVLDSYYCLKEGCYVGGIVGHNSGIIRNCYNEGMVSSYIRQITIWVVSVEQMEVGPLQTVIIQERFPTLFGILGLVVYVVEILIRFLIAIIPDQ